MTHITPDQTVAALLEQGMAALKRGDNAQACQLLGQAVRANPRQERAWLALAFAVAEPERRRYCLERCLVLNPANETARRALEQLHGQPAQPAKADEHSSAREPEPEEARQAATTGELTHRTSEPVVAVEAAGVEATSAAGVAVEEPGAASDSALPTGQEAERDLSSGADEGLPQPERVPEAPASTSSLAARLAAAEARRASEPGARRRQELEQAERARLESDARLRAELTQNVKRIDTDTPEPQQAEPEPQPEPEVKSLSATADRARKLVTPPLALRPVLLSEATVESKVAPTPEEVAEAALSRLLGQRRTGGGEDTPSTAMTVAQRYFYTPKMPKEPDEALRALAGDTERPPVRRAQLLGMLLIVSTLLLLLFSALLAMNQLPMV
jgi:hypothetical protein